LEAGSLEAPNFDSLDPELAWGDGVLDGLRAMGYEMAERYLVTALPAGVAFESYGQRAATVTRLVDDGDALDIGDRHFEVVHLPGHSPGSIGLWEEATGTLFSGDAIYDGSLLDQLPESDIDACVQRAFAGLNGKALKKGRPIAPAVLAGIQLGALRHPDPGTRRWCLYLLDHYANDQSYDVFAEALHDEVPHVRDLALHSIACEPCKQGDLCVADVVPRVITVLTNDPDANLRIKAIPVLLGLVARDGRARDAIRQAAVQDRDPLVRKCARDALAGYFVAPQKRYERSQRRHAPGKH
jgi:hypothetical protein